jgi:hypothetical protein
MYKYCISVIFIEIRLVRIFVCVAPRFLTQPAQNLVSKESQMSSLTNHDNLVDDILTHDGREILEDELSSPVFSNLDEIDARLPAFSRQGM